MSILLLWSSNRRLKLWTDAATQHQAHVVPYVNFSRDVLVTSSASSMCSFSSGKNGGITYVYGCNWTPPAFFPPVGTQYLQHPHSPPAHLSFLQDSGAPPPTLTTSFVYNEHAECKHTGEGAEVISWTMWSKQSYLLTELWFCCVYMQVKMGWEGGGGGGDAPSNWQPLTQRQWHRA